MVIYESADNILKILRQWKLEMNSPYNDGWVREGFKEKIAKVQEFFVPKHLDAALDKLKNSEGLATYEDEVELYETYGGD